MLADAIANTYLARSNSHRAAAASACAAPAIFPAGWKNCGSSCATRERARRLQGSNNFVGTGHADRRPAALRQQPAARRGAALTLDAQAKLDRIETSRRDSTDAGAIPEAAAIADHRRSAHCADTKKRQAELPRQAQVRCVPRFTPDREAGRGSAPHHQRGGRALRPVGEERPDPRPQPRPPEQGAGSAKPGRYPDEPGFRCACASSSATSKMTATSIQSFLKRSRGTIEETLNTSSARIIGETNIAATAHLPAGHEPARDDRLHVQGIRRGRLNHCRQPVDAGHRPASAQRPAAPKPMLPRQGNRSPIFLVLKPQSADREAADCPASEIRRDANARRYPCQQPGCRRCAAGLADAACGLSANDVSERHARCATLKRAAANTLPVMAVIGADDDERSIAALNIARCQPARDGAKIALDRCRLPERGAVQSKVAPFRRQRGEPSRPAQHEPARPLAPSIPQTRSRSCLPPKPLAPRRTTPGRATRSRAIVQARSTGAYDLVLILDGPVVPWNAADRTLLDAADGFIAVLPIHLDINDCMEDIITALGGAGRKLVGVVLNELNPTAVNRQRENNMRERRANPIGRAAHSERAAGDRGRAAGRRARLEQTADFMVDVVFRDAAPAGPCT